MLALLTRCKHGTQLDDATPPLRKGRVGGVDVRKLILNTRDKFVK